MRVLTRLALSLLWAALVPGCVGAQEPTAAKLLIGGVVARENGTPLEHAMVTVQRALRKNSTSCISSGCAVPRENLCPVRPKNRLAEPPPNGQLRNRKDHPQEPSSVPGVCDPGQSPLSPAA